MREKYCLALKKRAAGSSQQCGITCEECSTRAAFELALCYRIGFGTPADVEQSRHFLFFSTREETDIQDEIRLLRGARPKALDDQSPLARFSEEGSLYLSESTTAAIIGRRDSDREAVFLREISDLDSALGDVNYVTYTLKMALVTIYEQQGRFQLAEGVCRMALQSITALVGNSNAITLECTNRLARILRENRCIAEAECLQQSAIGLMTNLMGKDHLRTKRLLHDYCDTLELERRFQETADLREDVFNSLCVMLGATHPEVILAMDKWGLAKRYAGNLDFAATLHHLSFQYAEQDLGPRHYLTLTCVVNYAETMREQGEFEKAETWHRRAVEGFEIGYGIQHRQTAVAQHSLGVTLERQSKWLEALAMYHKALQTRVLVLGKSHVDTLASRNSWQSVLGCYSGMLVELQKFQDIAKTGPTEDAENGAKLVEIERNVTALLGQGKLGTAADLYFKSLKSNHETSKERQNENYFSRKIMQALDRIPTFKLRSKSKDSNVLPATPEGGTNSSLMAG